MKGRRRARGVALITAMLITAITGSLAAGLAWDNALDVRRTMVLLFHEQGFQVALGAESWIRNILRDDGIDSPTDHLGELWASDLPGLPVDNDSVQGAVVGNIEDLQGRFNVNNLIDANGEVDPDVLEQFQRLLVILEIDPRFAGLAADWIDADQDAGFPDGAEDSIYTGLIPPYRALNRSLTNVTELAALEGMDPASMKVLLPHVTALPRGTQINVNTATPVVLQSLDANLDVSAIEGLLSQREEAGFADYAQTFSTLVTNPAMFAQITETSSYFQLKAVVQIDTVRVTYYSVLSRSPNGGPVTTILRSLGTI
ncbi:MAG: type II secretion system minor pseudopilin GspK [Gammaproteobacteria bacterium]|nr:type II secretion system minor pseudopilin GspK [Gammaproteobacteria bacterium]